MHDFVVRKLEGSKLTDWSRLEKACGVPARTIEKVARRVYKSHRSNTIEPLAAELGYFEQFQLRRRKVS